MSMVTLSGAKGLMTRVVPLLVICMLCATTSAQAGIIQDVSASSDDIQVGGTVSIFWRMSQPASVKLSIFDSDMVLVKAYELGSRGVGSHNVRWDATDQSGARVAPEAYTWRIDAKHSGGTDIWEPAGLYSRAVEHITDYEWDPESRVFSYRAAVPMRMWARLGFAMGACMRILAEGEPRPAGVIAESWDGFDETGQINMLERQDRIISIFGYRLPQPCVIVSGAGKLSTTHLNSAFFPKLALPIRVEDPVWMRRRAFALADRSRPRLTVEQLGPDTFSASFAIPEELRAQQNEILQRTLADRVRLKWYIDGHCAAEDVDAVIPSLLTLFPDQLPKDGGKHFITANLMTAMHQVFTGSTWISTKENDQ
ncbi:MAG: hypothetical protein HYX75_13165 [Acidobacteria bacterium]|nr:hypothetical protein [Acidobacteriota bacterium]